MVVEAMVSKMAPGKTVADKLVRKMTMLNRAGLHARPSLAIVQTVRGSHSKVHVRALRQTVDAADILQLLSLGAAQGTELEFSAEGPDADEVLARLADLFATQFGLCDDA
jgi:phosphotransferase system HPr (HPr) family protein